MQENSGEGMLEKLGLSLFKEGIDDVMFLFHVLNAHERILSTHHRGKCAILYPV